MRNRATPGRTPRVYDADEILARMRADRDHDWPVRLIGALADAPIVDEPTLGKARLGERPIQFLQAASLGLTKRMIGDLYGVTEETVRTTLARTRHQLGAKNVTHAVALALRQGLLR